MHLGITNIFYLPTDAQEFRFKRDIKIYIKSAATCFCLITIIREHTIRASLKLLLLKTISQNHQLKYIRCLILHILLNHIAEFVFSNFSLLFL